MTLAQPLLFPRSVAIVGASHDPAKAAYRPLAYLRRAGYGGTVYPVAGRATVAGEPAWPCLAALPETPDHAFILLPTEHVADAVAECVRRCVPIATVLAGGNGRHLRRRRRRATRLHGRADCPRACHGGHDGQRAAAGLPR